MKLAQTVAPGTALREALDDIVRAGSGALIVIAHDDQLEGRIEGGLRLDAEFSPSRLYEVAKMDGAVVLDPDMHRITWVNVHLLADPALSSDETGIRHRVAQRTAMSTGCLVIAVSQRRDLITLYKGDSRYVVPDAVVTLARANQALQTLDRYRGSLEGGLADLTGLEIYDLVTGWDVVRVLERCRSVLAALNDVNELVAELGTGGRLVGVHMDEIENKVVREVRLIARDYHGGDSLAEADESSQALLEKPHDSPLTLVEIARMMQLGSTLSELDAFCRPRGYRILSKIAHLPVHVVENVVRSLGSLRRVAEASREELDAIEGIGPVRAESIKDGLARIREQATWHRRA